uniref:SSD domain-containing protein n=1 Tax=Meloidogyne incognita TaxID=6306 RepID=A0A914KSB8_MELIC
MELEKGINENSDSLQLPEMTLDDERSLEIPTGPFKEEDLAVFLRWPEYTQWSGFLKLDNKTGQLERFFFTTGYHGDKLEVWTERGKLLKEWRAVVDKYSPDFDASVFHEDAVFLDLIDNMPSDTWQSVLGTLVCMAFVCFAFLSSMFTVIFASSCVLSICCGILGILSWWSIDLDPIMMAAMIISIGFSVDIPAHVSYHYYQASIRELNATPEMKLVNCLSSVAFPALQAALSTIFCVCSLLFVKLYMAEVFVKTMVLCVVLCNLHGLLFLPAFLIVFDPVVYSCRQRISKSHSKVKQNNRIHNVIPEESGSQESSLKENTLINEKKRKLFNQNGLNKTINNDKQSTITDRPNLERFHSIELEGGGGGDKLKQEENENEEKVNNTKDNPDINSISNQKIDDTSH